MNTDTMPETGFAKFRSRLGYRFIIFWYADFFSPADLCKRACILTLLFALVHLVGLREFTTFLNGAVESVALGRQMSSFFGLIYIFAYLGFVLLVPMLLIAAGLVCIFRGVKLQ